MLSQPEVIEVEKSVFALLLYAYPGKAYCQRLGQYLKRIAAVLPHLHEIESLAAEAVVAHSSS